MPVSSLSQPCALDRPDAVSKSLGLRIARKRVLEGRFACAAKVLMAGRLNEF
jgi:hypothetical protein